VGKTMAAFGYALFDTVLGPCGVAWGAHGLRAVQLPESDAAAARARLLRRAPGAVEAPPSALAQQAIDGVTALLAGTPVGLGSLPLDTRDLPELHVRIYDIVRRIPCGSTLSYGQVAERLGDRRLARAVGQAMARNPFAPVVPCHRVLGAAGHAGGFSARGGLRTKLLLLTIERARLSEQPDLFTGLRDSAE
jgi:methylated-DNA-[protein]-cysteine S-methyltransferase